MQSEDTRNTITEYVHVSESDTIDTQSAGKIIIPISRAGVIAATVAGSIGYTVTNAMMRTTGSAAGITVNTVGYIAEKAAGLVAGPVGEVTVSVARKMLAETTEKSITAQAPMTALMVSSIAGTGACLAVTAGSFAFNLVTVAAKKIANVAVATAERIHKYKEEQPVTYSNEYTCTDIAPATEDNRSSGHGNKRST
jgi:hypothetical protein